MEWRRHQEQFVGGFQTTFVSGLIWSLLVILTAHALGIQVTWNLIFLLVFSGLVNWTLRKVFDKGE